MPIPDDPIDSTEAAEILGWSRGHFNRRVSEGAIPVAMERPGRTGLRLFERAEILRIAAERDLKVAS